jgi:chromosome segregation ATPase
MIARTASVSLIVKDFGSVEASVKAIAQRHNGYIASLNSTSPQEAARSLTATLRIPSAQLESAIAELKQLGHVEQESQSGEEVTKEFTDRAARMKNARATEERLLDVLRNHTGQVKDILATEQEIARVRGDIEQMEADHRALQTRVDFATVELSVQEEYKASLQSAPPSTGRRLRNAGVEGYRSVVESVIVFGVWALESLPTLLLWGFVLFVPTRWLWKRLRRTAVSQS